MTLQDARELAATLAGKAAGHLIRGRLDPEFIMRL